MFYAILDKENSRFVTESEVSNTQSEIPVIGNSKKRCSPSKEELQDCITNTGMEETWEVVPVEIVLVPTERRFRLFLISLLTIISSVKSAVRGLNWKNRYQFREITNHNKIYIKQFLTNFLNVVAYTVAVLWGVILITLLIMVVVKAWQWEPGVVIMVVFLIVSLWSFRRITF